MPLRLSQWRPSFLSWLSGKLPINDWSLNAPDRVGKVAGLLPPLSNIAYKSADEGQTIGTATQVLFAVYAYSPTTPYIELPVAALEGAYQSLSIEASQNWSNISDELLSFQQVPVDEPIVVRRRTNEQQAWNIELCWQWRLTFTAEPEVPFDFPQVTSVNSAIYRASIESFDNNVLDYSGTIEDIEVVG